MTGARIGQKPAVDEFVRIGREPFFWRIMATEHARAARLIREVVISDRFEEDNYFKLPPGEAANARESLNKPNLIRPYFLSIALAVENLLKACLIAMNPNFVEEGGKLSKQLQTHNLTLLAERAGFNLSDDERKFCDFLSKMFTALGRYPIALSAGHQESAIGFSYDDTVFTTFTNLCERFDNRLMELMV